MRKVIKSLRDGVCYNQGELAQFSFFSSLLHKSLKEELASSDDSVGIAEHMRNLSDYLSRNYKRIALKNFSLLEDYFKGKSTLLPRICIKGYHEKDIVDLFRDDKSFFVKSYPIKSNTGFQEVYQTGKYFLCNDLPERIKSGKYINPRIDINKVSGYHRNVFFDALSFFQNIIGQNVSHFCDEEWAKCWYDYDSSDEKKHRCSSFYKSTLIIPMTLWNSKVSKEFLETFELSDIDIGRLIFGFLCFDHSFVNYFDDIDVDVGYIYADLLSLYMIHTLMYTDYSQAYRRASSIVDNSLNSS